MRYRTSRILMWLALPVLALGVGGTLWTLWSAPASRWILPSLFALGVAAARDLFEEPWVACAVLSGALTSVLGGSYALCAATGSFEIAFWVGAGGILLILTILFRALIAAGSADWPYEDLPEP